MAVQKTPLYLNNGRIINVVTPLVILGYLFSLWFIARGRLVTENSYTLICEVIGAFWLLAPPLWFYFEQVHYFPRHGNPEAGFAGLKMRQDVLNRLWFGAVLLLAALFTGTTVPR